MKTWKDIRVETLNLGFEKNKAYEKNKQAYVDAYNWAQALIASTVGGVHKTMAVGGTSTRRLVFDLAEMSKAYDSEFISLSGVGITDLYNGKIDGYTFTDNRFLILPEDIKEPVLVHYMGMPARITTATADDTECELPDKWANCMPYLMANRLYLDDDAGKAGYYWNLYEDMKNQILMKEYSSGATVIGGYDIDIVDGWCW